MKKFSLLSILILMISLNILFTSCYDDLDLEEPCNDTKKELINAGAIVNVTVVTNDGLPVVDAYLKVSIHKSPCTGDAHGYFNFNGFTDENGKFKTTVVYYNLGNSEDYVYADVTITATGKVEAEKYGYSNFTDGKITDLYIKIYDN